MRQPLIHLLAANALAGATAAVVVVVGLIVLDVGGIGRLLSSTESPAIAVSLFTCGFVVLLSSVAMGAAIMRLGSDPERGASGGGTPARIPVVLDRRR